jgi:hypothetical protein
MDETARGSAQLDFAVYFLEQELGRVLKTSSTLCTGARTPRPSRASEHESKPATSVVAKPDDALFKAVTT